MSEKKSTGKSAGSTKQWRQLGSGKHQDSEESESQTIQAPSNPTIQPSEHLDVPPSEHSTIQEAKQPDSQLSNHLSIQPSKSSDTGESSMLDTTMAEHLSVQKSRSKQRDKLTVYLEPDLNDWIRQQVIIEKRRRGHHVEISDIINEALRRAKEQE